MISFVGSEGRAEIDARHLEELPAIRHQYESAVGAPVTIGVGQKLSEADRALLAGKLKGGNQVVLYTPDVEHEIQAAAKPRTEAEKVTDAAGLGKAEVDPASPEFSSPALNQGQGNAGITGGHQPAAPKTPQKPVAEGSEHSQGEAAAAFAEANHVSPEGTHAAQDLESQFHEAAKDSDEDDQPQGEDPHVLKQRVVQVLQEIKSQAKVIAQLKQVAPKAYEAVMDLVTEMIQIARTLPVAGGGGGQGDKSGEVKKSEKDADAETKQIKTRRKSPEGRAPHKFKSAQWTHPNGHPRCALCGDEERTDGHCLGADHDGLGKAEPAFVEAGFLHKPSGMIYGTGAFHDINKLPTDYNDEYEDGFITPEGHFLTREQAAEALRRPEGRNLQSEDLSEMGLGRKPGEEHLGKSAPPGFSEDAMYKLKAKYGVESAFKIAWAAHNKKLGKSEDGNPVVYRVENANRDGPYKTGDLKQDDSNPNQPVAHTDFDPQIFAAMDQNGYRFGFENPQQALQWFGAKTFRALQQKGYKLVQASAKNVWHSKSGTQCVYEPAEALDKANLPMPHATPHHHVKWPVGSVNENKQRVKIVHRNPATGEPESGGFVQVQDGQVLSHDGHTISSRNPGGR